MAQPLTAPCCLCRFVSVILIVLKDALRCCPSCLLAALLVYAQAPAWAIDYRDTPKSKLDAAVRFVKDFLARDAEPKEVFFIRDVSFPVWNGYPLVDCEIKSFVRAIEQRGVPTFDDAKRTVVNVPVVAELLLVDAGQAGGGPDYVRPGVEGYSWCSFEYERYDFQRQRFEKLPLFRQHTLNIEFKTWGEALPQWRSTPMPKGFEDDRYVAVDLDKRYVRYVVRVNVTRETPYRIWPQVPRHWFAKDAIAKLERINRERMELLRIGSSDRSEPSSGDKLAADLVRMRHQLEQTQWRITKLKDRLTQLEAIPPFSDVQDQDAP